MRAPLMLFGLLVIATACTSGGSSPPTTTPTTSLGPAPEVVFETTLTQGPDAIVVRWSLSNASGGQLLVPNLVPDKQGRFSSTADTVYVVPGVDADVELAKRVFESDGDARDSLPLVGVTRLADGASIREEVRVPLPLIGYSPNGDATLPTGVGSVVFCVGVVSPPFIPSMGFNRHDDIETMNHGVAASQQYVSCSEPLILD